VQIGAPSRTHIKRYHDLFAEVEAEADRINWRFQSGKWKPIVFLKRQHSHQEIEPYYRAADLCLVTSLHDGMNLVAKEFLAARRDERGVLILSQFTGAARELRDALLVNPYDIDQTADAIRAALEMEPEDKQLRMHRMRKLIKERNIYRWAGNLITELCEVRLDAPEDQARRKFALSRMQSDFEVREPASKRKEQPVEARSGKAAHAVSANSRPGLAGGIAGRLRRNAGAIPCRARSGLPISGSCAPAARDRTQLPDASGYRFRA
jgi:trehalose-6-phosphate synthase